MESDIALTAQRLKMVTALFLQLRTLETKVKEESKKHGTQQAKDFIQKTFLDKIHDTRDKAGKGPEMDMSALEKLKAEGQRLQNLWYSASMQETLKDYKELEALMQKSDEEPTTPEYQSPQASCSRTEKTYAEATGAQQAQAYGQTGDPYAQAPNAAYQDQQQYGMYATTPTQQWSGGMYPTAAPNVYGNFRVEEAMGTPLTYAPNTTFGGQGTPGFTMMQQDYAELQRLRSMEAQLYGAAGTNAATLVYGTAAGACAMPPPAAAANAGPTTQYADKTMNTWLPQPQGTPSPPLGGRTGEKSSSETSKQGFQFTTAKPFRFTPQPPPENRTQRSEFSSDSHIVDDWTIGDTLGKKIDESHGIYMRLRDPSKVCRQGLQPLYERGIQEAGMPPIRIKIKQEKNGENTLWIFARNEPEKNALLTVTDCLKFFPTTLQLSPLNPLGRGAKRGMYSDDWKNPHARTTQTQTNTLQNTTTFTHEKRGFKNQHIGPH
jgi:hypothetical protein